MKAAFIIFISLLTINSSAQKTAREFSQYYKSIKQHFGFKMDSVMKEECDSAIKDAITDSLHGEVKYYFIGMLDQPYLSQISFVCNKYHMGGETTGCTPEVYHICYNAFTDDILELKYGKDFWDKVYTETDSLRKVGLLDRRAFYKGGYEQLEEDFIQAYKSLFPKSRLKKIEVGVKITIDSTGRLVKVEDGEYFPKSDFNSIATVLKQLQNWEPKIEFGRKVSTDINLFEIYRMKRRNTP